MYNQFQLVGRLTRKAEMKEFNDSKLASFTIAQNKYTKDKQSEGMFFDCKAWNKTADKVRNIDKGELIIITGSLDQEKWTNKDGKPVSKIVLRVNNVMLIPKSQNYTDKPDEAIYPETLDLGDPIF